VTGAMLAMAAMLAAGGSPEVAAEWKELAPLLGDWTAVGTGKPGEGTGGFTLTPDAGGKVLVRRSFAEYPKQPRHDDLMVIYREGGAIKASFFDSEGHVIRYAVTAGEKKAVFLSEPGPGPRFRLTYDWGDAQALKILFEVAAPNAPDKFTKYLEGSARRR
jgi:hypothetical protein